MMSEAPADGTQGEFCAVRDPRHVLLDAREVMRRYGWGKTKGYHNLKDRDLVQRPVMTHPDRWRLDQLLAWDDRRITAAESDLRAVPGPPRPGLLESFQPQISHLVDVADHEPNMRRFWQQGEITAACPDGGPGRADPSATGADDRAGEGDPRGHRQPGQGATPRATARVQQPARRPLAPRGRPCPGRPEVGAGDHPHGLVKMPAPPVPVAQFSIPLPRAARWLRHSIWPRLGGDHRPLIPPRGALAQAATDVEESPLTAGSPAHGGATQVRGDSDPASRQHAGCSTAFTRLAGCRAFTHLQVSDPQHAPLLLSHMTTSRQSDRRRPGPTRRGSRGVLRAHRRNGHDHQ